MAKKSTSTKATTSKAPRARTAPARAEITTRTLEEILRQLESLCDEKTRAHNSKYGAGDNQFGVKLGDIRTLANKIKTNHELGKDLEKVGGSPWFLLDREQSIRYIAEKRGVILGALVLTFVIFWALPNIGEWSATLGQTLNVPSLGNIDFAAAAARDDWTERRRHCHVPSHAQSWVCGGIQLSGCR